MAEVETGRRQRGRDKGNLIICTVLQQRTRVYWSLQSVLYVKLCTVSITLRRKGSIKNLKRFYQRYVFGTPKRFYALLKKGSSGFYIEPWGSILGQ